MGIEAQAYLRAAGLVRDQFGGSPISTFDYLTWADADSVYEINAPIRLEIQELRQEMLAQPLGVVARGACGSAPCDAALGALVADAQAGYPALRHTMNFPEEAGFSAGSVLQSSDIFSRAIVLEVLAMASRQGRLACDEMLVSGVDYLLRARRGDDGWAYFPGLLELPADCDTLAQVALTMLACDRSDLVNEVIVPQILRYEQSLSDGSFGTWMFSEDGRIGGIQRLFAQNAWGMQSDTEVLANLAHAVRCVDAERFADLLDALQGAVGRRALFGLWESAWYHGPYYGAFVAARALRDVSTYEDVVLKNAGIVAAMQHEDGGWGLEHASSDALSTAFAMLTLAWSDAAEHASRLDRGAAFLGACADGGLADVPFIRMNLGRARCQDGPYLNYGSPSITAAYAALALMTCERGAYALS